ncbi:N-acetylgalactosamine-6-sulfatase [Aquimarina sp. BL5]|uniref:sulfatase-like hydrolase/transferase n=1 Tax=Aquimarina sp. BL5 TaxID=1714860 RepID=UPI000E4A2263|nr:sulfatase-like hydrolase/transferase [Aquimarina sp. BL5]AXT50231.1 N-acetylgalactosamine-6-sulfatase [Aquimarina sp. BL5]RKN09547.1 N-acetylgalactosamine-6-sulfatase [Aquimarina sp. BL5]
MVLKNYFFLILVLFFLGCKNTSEIQVSKPPNIIVILTDDQGWRDVGFNGATDIPTKNLDRLAKEGTIFSNGYVSHPYCSPSRAGLLTGRYQARFGHDCNLPYKDDNDASIGTPLSEIMISEALKKQGYTTSAIGKWHVGDHPDLHPNKQGFDHWFGFPGGNTNYWGFPENYLKTIYRNGKPVDRKNLSYLTDDFTNEAVNFIDKNDDKPFFIYLAYNAPHAPDQTTKKYLENTKHIENAERSIYGAMVNGVDIGVGKIDSTLVAKGIKDNTLIVFLSDNGGRKKVADNQPNRGYKGMLFEGGIKVPFFMTWKNGIKNDKIYKNPVSALDIFPTLLNIAGGNAKDEPQLDGKDLLPYLNNETEKPHNLLFWRSSGGFEYAVRKDNFKLYKSAFKGKTLLFDLEKDPNENFDISDENVTKIKELNKAYANWDSKNINPNWYDPHPENVLKDKENYIKKRNNSLHPKIKKKLNKNLN